MGRWRSLRSSRQRPISNGASVSYIEKRMKRQSNITDDPSSTGAKLLRYASEKGVSKYRLAEQTGLSYTTIERITKGDEIGQVHSWVLICRALGIDTGELGERIFNEGH